MKKILFVVMATVAMTFASCGNKTSEVENDSVAVDTLVIDSTVIDSTTVDSVVTE